MLYVRRTVINMSHDIMSASARRGVAVTAPVVPRLSTWCSLDYNRSHSEEYVATIGRPEAATVCISMAMQIAIRGPRDPGREENRLIGPLRVGPGASRPASRTSADPPLGTPTPPRHRSRAARSRTERHWESQGTPISGALHQNPHLEPRFPDGGWAESVR